MEGTSHPQKVSPNQLQVVEGFSVVGSGALAGALVRAFTSLGMTLNCLVVRDRNRAPDWTAKQVAQLGDDLHPRTSEPWIVCVPDDAVASVARSLATSASFKDVVVLHTAGALNADSLKPLRKAQAAVGSLHPLQSFSGMEGADFFRGITFGIEGDGSAVAMARRLVETLAAHAVEVDSAKKDLYHATAVLAGNAATTLLSVAQEIWECSAGTRDGFAQSLGPLVRTSMLNTLDKGPETALTGPIVRGDTGTLKRHLDAIHRYLPHLTPLYGSLATETVHLALRSGRLHAEKAVAMLDEINTHLMELNASSSEDQSGQPNSGEYDGA